MNDAELVWDDLHEKNIFDAEGLKSFDDFWNIEDCEKIELQVQRQHIKEDGEITRQTVRVPFKDKIYFLKRTSGSAYQCIKNEYNALNFVVEFNLVPPQVSVHCFDDRTQRGFILFKDMDGFYSLHDIYNKTVSKDVLEKVGDTTKYHAKIIDIFKEFQKSQYFYRDWMAKHIFINPETDNIGLIDLERFLPRTEVPFYWSLPFIYGYKRKKEQKKLLKALQINSL